MIGGLLFGAAGLAGISELQAQIDAEKRRAPKPHLFQLGGLWWCVGAPGFGWGYSPREAWEDFVFPQPSWLKMRGRA